MAQWQRSEPIHERGSPGELKIAGATGLAERRPNTQGRQMKNVPPAGKLLAFDLETSRLDANRGFIICAAARWVGQREFYTWRIDEGDGYGKTPRSYFNDSHIVAGLIPLLEEADAVLAYYGTGFDVPFVNTRAVANKIKPPSPFTVIDPWKTARSKLKLERNSMAAVAELFDTPHQKQHIPWPEWQRAQFGDSKAIDKLLKYNVQDVRVLEEVYYGIRPLIADHPYLGVPVVGKSPKLRCPACGSEKSWSFGHRHTKCYRVFRRRCTKCQTAFESHRQKIA